MCDCYEHLCAEEWCGNSIPTHISGFWTQRRNIEARCNDHPPPARERGWWWFDVGDERHQNGELMGRYGTVYLRHVGQEPADDYTPSGATPNAGSYDMAQGPWPRTDADEGKS